ncbi:MAG: radical SAM family heme chaperone HemW [bacterium]|nr:radical SAM family heme chaperone HemW [candidate division KSB1 bacterium]MDH7558939.1 radical SAM family heme chaperone HemW [bacterium]
MAGSSAEPLPPAGLYVHVPFCRRKCPYCDFYSVPFRTEEAEHFLAALQREMRLWAKQGPLAGTPFTTLYIGGGTPSLLTPAQLSTIFSAVDSLFRLHSGAEVTLEANPATLSASQLCALRTVGVNRLSLGVQSLHEGELHTLGRLHTAAEAERTFRQAREAGFDNLSVDLIFGIPGQTTASWEATLRKVIDWSPEHLSTYALTLEPCTPMAQAVARGALRPVGTEEEKRMYLLAHDLLTANGYEHYEISNYAKPGSRCRHNMQYWQRHPYLGLGPSAHSFHGNQRWWNVADVSAYCQALAHDSLPVQEREVLTGEQGRLETIMLALRTAEGLELRSLPPESARRALEGAARLSPDGKHPLALLDAERIRLTHYGFLVHEEVCRLLA